MARLLIDDIEAIQEMGRSGDRDKRQHRGDGPYTSEAVPPDSKRRLRNISAIGIHC